MQISLKFFKNQISASKKYKIALLSLYLVSLLIIILCACFCSVPFATSKVFQKNVSILYLFKNNMISMFKSCIFGFVTFGVYSIRMFLINTFAVGIIIHSLILDRKSILALKLIPHGIIEFFVIALQVLFPMAIWIYLIGNLKKILQSELKIKDMFMQIIFYVIQTLLLSTNLLLIAAIIEHFISLIKL